MLKRLQLVQQAQALTQDPAVIEPAAFREGKPVLKLAELDRLLRSFLLEDFTAAHSENTRNALGAD